MASLSATKLEMSILGSALNTTSALGGDGASKNATARSAPTSHDRTSLSVGGTESLSDRITRKYTDKVVQAESERRANFVPLEQREMVRPDEREMARSLKRDLDVTLTKASPGPPESGQTIVRDRDYWKKLTDNDFQKRLEYLSNHARTGHFIEQYGTNGRYEGEFMHGQRHGSGCHVFGEEHYEGEWKWDQRHGWGTFTLRDASVMKGEWQKGKPHGYQTIANATGNVIYEGEFKDGKRHGLGRQLFESGDMYDGNWASGKLDDRGVYYFTNGDRLYGMWKKGVYDGVGFFHYVDGSVSRRVYKDGALCSVQDYEGNVQRFGKSLTREGMHLHTQARGFPQEVFMLHNV